MGACLSWLMVVAGGTIAATGPERPNLVVILADDLGYGDVHALNPQRGRIPTPHLDRLAAEGMVFTDAHSGSSVCTPTRYGLLTGRYAWRTRLQQGVLDGGSEEPLIAADRLTVGGLLQQQGYHTACLGKWHLGFRSDADGPNRATNPKRGRGALPVGATLIGGPTTRGFDLFFGCSNARTMASLIDNTRVIESLEPIDMLPRLSARAVAYLESQKSERPFFLYLPLTSPHTPIVPAADWQGKSGLGDYADFVMQTDAVVGTVLDTLARTGLAKNTMVIVSSDNGCSPAAKVAPLEKRGHYPSGPYRGYKSDIWEGGHRVPFVVRWPGQVRAGSTCTQTICLTDLMATCADLLDVTLPPTAGEDSVSILPALRGLDRGPLREAVVHHSISGQFAIRQGPWKLAWCPGSGGWGKPGDAEAAKKGFADRQLYQLEADPAETDNRVAHEPEVAARLSSLLEQYIARGRSTPGPDQANDVAVRSPLSKR